MKLLKPAAIAMAVAAAPAAGATATEVPTEAGVGCQSILPTEFYMSGDDNTVAIRFVREGEEYRIVPSNDYVDSDGDVTPVDAYDMGIISDAAFFVLDEHMLPLQWAVAGGLIPRLRNGEKLDFLALKSGITLTHTNIYGFQERETFDPSVRRDDVALMGFLRLFDFALDDLEHAKKVCASDANKPTLAHR